jgi:hypothetical protein
MTVACLENEKQKHCLSIILELSQDEYLDVTTACSAVERDYRPSSTLITYRKKSGAYFLVMEDAITGKNYMIKTA